MARPPSPCCIFLAVACQAEKLVAKLDALGGTAGDLGLSLFKVAKFEVGACACATCRCTHTAAHTRRARQSLTYDVSIEVCVSHSILACAMLQAKVLAMARLSVLLTVHVCLLLVLAGGRGWCARALHWHRAAQQWAHRRPEAHSSSFGARQQNDGKGAQDAFVRGGCWIYRREHGIHMHAELALPWTACC